MKNKIIPSISKNVQSDNLQLELRVQQSQENKLSPRKKSNSIMLPMISMCISLMIIIIPIIWFIFMCNTADDDILTELSDLDINDAQRYVLSPDCSQSSDRFGYNFESVKIPQYRNVPMSFRKPGRT